MVAATALAIALIANALLANAVPVAKPITAPRSLKLKGAPRLHKRGADRAAELQAVRAKWEANVAREQAASTSTRRKVKRATGSVALTDDIEQGVDTEYYGNLQIGTPAQTVVVNFDSGSADLWVRTTCNNCQGDGNSFDLTTSSTYKSTGEPFQIQYGSGAVAGTLASDTVSLGGLAVSQQYFGSVNRASYQFQQGEVDGILGLAFPSIATDREPTVFENLVNSNALDAPQFSFFLARDQASGSELSLGAVDSSKFTGETYYSNVTSQTYWEVSSTGMAVNGAAVSNGFSAAIDSGTTLLYVPTEVASAFYAAIPGAQEISTDSLSGSGGAGQGEGEGAGEGSGTYVYPCNTNATIAIAFEGTPALNIDLADLNLGEVGQGYCEGGITGADIQGANGEALAIVGDLFLKNWYSTFDLNGPRVGFAQAVQSSST